MDLLLFSDWHGWSENNHFYNNIFYAAGTAGFSYAISRDADGAYVTAHGFGASKENTFDANVDHHATSVCYFNSGIRALVQ